MSESPSTTTAAPQGDGSYLAHLSPTQLADYLYSIVEAHPDCFSEQYPHAMTEAASVIERLERDRARLIEVLEEAIDQASNVWVEANGLRDSKAAGKYAARWRVLLNDLTGAP